MKSLLLVLVSMLTIMDVNAQVLYNHGDTIKGKAVSYYCVELIPNRTIRVRNTQNKDTLSNMYFDDGKIVPDDRMLESNYNFEFEQFIQTFKDALTFQEINQLKNARGSFIVNVVTDKAGNALELDFIFPKNDPVLSKFAPDRLFQLETKLKKLLKLNIGGEDRKIKNVKYMVVISFNKDLK